ncbi:porin [Caldimonas brevitalea]|uniref:Porin domain-containing protein n=1 Tax=Caldimonas brevitalea TaxID=413882 RepID=A0A0G3BSG0_9BURK|nr:porin [Caldimonas brevitalea]AKJ30316.1 hypothetical protein AAW51_3625 [Caldimonas brevitalea]
MAIKQVALAAMAFVAGASANAQTSGVTLYGVADAFVQYTDADDSVTRLQSGGLNGSRLGLRGVEDLGGGLRAVFTIEHGFSIDNGGVGQSEVFWGRQAFVGLAGNFGQVTLGRQYSSIYPATNDFSAFTSGSYGPSTGVIGGFGGYEPVRGTGGTAATAGTVSGTGLGGPIRINNSVKYETPSLGGLKIGALWGMGEAADSATDTRVADIYARYSAGPIDAIVSFVDDRIEATDVQHRTITAAATYSFGAFRLLGGYLKLDDRGATDVDGDGWWLGGEFKFGPSTLRAQYVANNPDQGDNDSQAFGVGYQYDLSKRTALYTAVTHFKNDGTIRYNSSVPGGIVPTGATGENINEFAVGVRHSF